jgi:hypothetical protein
MYKVEAANRWPTGIQKEEISYVTTDSHHSENQGLRKPPRGIIGGSHRGRRGRISGLC